MALPTNTTILGSIYLAGTSDYQQRVPDPTQSSVAETMEFLFDPMNRNYFNQFMDILVNRVGLVLARERRWDNRLAAFKDGMMSYGATVEECGFKWVQAHAYDDNATDLLRMERPDGVTVFHSQNRQDKYKITINEAELQTAFLDEYGLSNYVASLMTIPQNSDNYDEYQIMKHLIADYDERWGFFRYHLSKTPMDEESAKEFLTAVRTMTGKLQFPTALYNAQVIEDIPVFANPDELVLLLTPEVEGVIDVQALASIFHVELADINVRRVIMDSIPIENAVALLTTRDFFMCRDTRYQTATFYDPNTLNQHYFLHHWGIYSVSPLVPAILFTTDAASVNAAVEVAPRSMTLTNELSPEGIPAITPGSTIPLTAAIVNAVTGFDSGEPLYNRFAENPNSFVWQVIGFTKDDGGETVLTGAQPNARTRVDKYGVLHLQKTAPRGINADNAEQVYEWTDLLGVRVHVRSTYGGIDADIDIPIAH